MIIMGNPRETIIITAIKIIIKTVMGGIIFSLSIIINTLYLLISKTIKYANKSMEIIALNST